MNYNLLWQEYFYTWITEPVNWFMIHKTQSLKPSLIILVPFHGTRQNFPPQYYLGRKFKTQVSHNKICFGYKPGLTWNKCKKLLKGHNEKCSGNQWGSLAGKLTVFITTFSSYVDNQFILQMYKNFYLGSIVSCIVHYWLCDSH